MLKRSLTILLLLLTVSTIFVVTPARTVLAACPPDCGSATPTQPAPGNPAQGGTPTTPAQGGAANPSGGAARASSGGSFCSSGILGQLYNFTFGDGFSCIIAWIVTTVMEFFGLFVYYSGVFLNFIVYITILHMGDTVQNLNAVNIGWSTLRDVGNMFFIFILIYIAIITILGMRDSGQWKQLVLNVIIIALLVNFSMFFTKVAIDASNLLTIQFYQGIVGQNINDRNAGLSWTFTNALRLTTIYDPNAIVRGQAPQVTTDAQAQVGAAATARPGTDSVWNIVLMSLMGSIFFLVTAFVFLATGIMLAIRFVVLIVLIVVSPVAFVAWILPEQTRKYFDDWLHRLTDQLIFAPVLMILLWLVARIMNSCSFINALTGGNITTGCIDPVVATGATAAGQNLNFSTAILSGSPGSIGVIANFVLIIAFMIVSIVAAKKTGAQGASFATKWAGKFSFGAAGFLGRNTLGRASRYIANSERLQTATEKRGWVATPLSYLASGTLSTARRGAKSSFDARNTRGANAAFGLADIDAGTAKEGGYDARIEAKKKADKEYAESLHGYIYDTKANETLARELDKNAKAEDENIKNIQTRVSSHQTQVDTIESKQATVAAKQAYNTLENEVKELERQEREARANGQTATAQNLQNTLTTKRGDRDRAKQGYNNQFIVDGINQKQALENAAKEKFEAMKRRDDFNKRLENLRHNNAQSTGDASLARKASGKTVTGIIGHVTGGAIATQELIQETHEKEQKEADKTFKTTQEKKSREDKLKTVAEKIQTNASARDLVAENMNRQRERLNQANRDLSNDRNNLKRLQQQNAPAAQINQAQADIRAAEQAADNIRTQDIAPLEAQLRAHDEIARALQEERTEINRQTSST